MFFFNIEIQIASILYICSKTIIEILNLCKKMFPCMSIIRFIILIKYSIFQEADLNKKSKQMLLIICKST